MFHNTNFTRKPFVLTLLIFSACLFCAGQGFAQWSMVVQDLIKTADEYYENGHYAEAIHEYSKTLLADPGNEDALAGLRKMGLEGGVYGTGVTTLQKICRLNNDILAYRSELQDLQTQSASKIQMAEQQKQQLEQMIRKKDQEKQQLLQTHEELRAVATMMIQDQQEYITQLEDTATVQHRDLTRTSADLAQVNAALTLAQQQIRSNEDAFVQQGAELNALKDDYEKNQRISEEELRMLELQYAERYAALEKERNDLSHEVFDVRNEYRTRMQDYQKILLDKEAQLRMEKNLSDVKSYRIVQQEARYLDTKKMLDKLWKQKVRLTEEAGQLRDQIAKLSKKQTFRYANTAPEKRIKGDKLIAHVRKQDEMIMDFKTRIVDLLNQIDELRMEEESGASQERIIDLQRKVGRMQAEVEEKEKDLEFANEQQDILEERIREYQKRLDIVEGMMRDREERILSLEEQLDADVYPDTGEKEDGGI